MNVNKACITYSKSLIHSCWFCGIQPWPCHPALVPCWPFEYVQRDASNPTNGVPPQAPLQWQPNTLANSYRAVPFGGATPVSAMPPNFPVPYAYGAPQQPVGYMWKIQLPLPAAYLGSWPSTATVALNCNERPQYSQCFKFICFHAFK